MPDQPGPPSIRLAQVTRPEGTEVIAGQGFFSPLSVEDIFHAVAVSAPGAEFGVAMVEGSSGVVRRTGNAPELVEAATENAQRIGAGHFFVILLRNAFPTQVLPAVRGLPSVVNIFCATGNPLQLVLADSDQGTGVIGAIDGMRAASPEAEPDQAARRAFLRDIGYFEQDPAG